MVERSFLGGNFGVTSFGFLGDALQLICVVKKILEFLTVFQNSKVRSFQLNEFLFSKFR